MTLRDFEIDKDIRRASTLPARVYSDPEYFDAQKDRVFARSWQYVGDAGQRAGTETDQRESDAVDEGKGGETLSRERRSQLVAQAASTSVVLRPSSTSMMTVSTART